MKYPMLKSALLAAAVALCAAAPSYAASPLTGTFTVQATVTDACNTLVTNTLNLGAYDPFGAGTLSSSATFNFTCTKGTTFSSVDMSGTVGSRSMSNGTDTIGYELYQPSGDGAAATCPNTVTWGAGTPVGAGKGYKPATVASKNTPTTLRVCGVSAAQGQNVSGGTYTDTVTITINYL